MSTTKNYNFDGDTKRYVSLVNSYRLIAGFSKLKVEDVVDIDNFIVGLKELGLYEYMNIWLFIPKYNSIYDRKVLPLHAINFRSDQQIGTLSSTITISEDGCISVAGATISGINFIADPTEITIGFVGTMPTSGGRGGWVAIGGTRTDATFDNTMLWLNPRTGFGGEFRFSGSFVSIAENDLTGFNSWGVTGKLGDKTIAYRNGLIAATSSANASTIPYNSQTVVVGFCRNGLFEGTASLSYIAKKRFTPQQILSINSLIKVTVGKNLGLP
jgi:hypothetical protein